MCEMQYFTDAIVETIDWNNVNFQQNLSEITGYELGQLGKSA